LLTHDEFCTVFVARHGEGVDEADIARDLVVGEFVSAIVADLVVRGRLMLAGSPRP
jgi:hypothetical protein